MSVKNEDIYKLLCNVHSDIGELKGATTTLASTLKEHIEDDKRVIRAVYDTQIQPIAAQVDSLRISQAAQKGRTKVWGLVATAAGSVLGVVAGAASSLIKWH
jgi:hypothetical protein